MDASKDPLRSVEGLLATGYRLHYLDRVMNAAPPGERMVVDILAYRRPRRVIGRTLLRESELP